MASWREAVAGSGFCFKLPQTARHNKPDVPLPDMVDNDLVYARVVLHSEPRYDGEVVAEWLARMNCYLERG